MPRKKRSVGDAVRRRAAAEGKMKKYHQEQKEFDAEGRRVIRQFRASQVRSDVARKRRGK